MFIFDLHFSADEGSPAEFSCTGTGPKLLQINSNLIDPTGGRVTASADDSSGDDGDTINYIFANTTRDDNGTTIQCFANAVGSNIITLSVECESIVFFSSSIYYRPLMINIIIIITVSRPPAMTSITRLRPC